MEQGEPKIPQGPKSISLEDETKRKKGPQVLTPEEVDALLSDIETYNPAPDPALVGGGLDNEMRERVNDMWNKYSRMRFIFDTEVDGKKILDNEKEIDVLDIFSQVYEFMGMANNNIYHKNHQKESLNNAEKLLNKADAIITDALNNARAQKDEAPEHKGEENLLRRYLKGKIWPLWSTKEKKVAFSQINKAQTVKPVMEKEISEGTKERMSEVWSFYNEIDDKYSKLGREHVELFLKYRDKITPLFDKSFDILQKNIGADKTREENLIISKIYEVYKLLKEANRLIDEALSFATEGVMQDERAKKIAEIKAEMEAFDKKAGKKEARPDKTIKTEAEKREEIRAEMEKFDAKKKI